jgi:gamma-glutamyltranspeptidase
VSRRTELRVGGLELLNSNQVPRARPLRVRADAGGGQLLGNRWPNRHRSISQTGVTVMSAGRQLYSNANAKRCDYDGPVGTRLVAGLASMGSRLTEADFRRHSTEVTPPVAVAYRDFEVLVPPPNSQGFVLLEIMGCVERGRLAPDHLGPDAATLAQIFRLASADRDNFLADPRYAPVPIDDLLSAQHTRELLDQAGQLAGPGSVSRRATGDTVGIVAVQEDGPWVAINHSLYDAVGSGILEPNTGIICHNRGSYFSLDRSALNILVGSKRPAHTLMPVMVMREGRPMVASATMGGSAHAQIHAELLLAVLDGGETPADAISNPRWLVGGTQRYGGPGIVAEGRVPAEVVERMVAAAFEVQMLDDWDEQVGHAQMAARAPDGSLSAAFDPRADGSAGAG